MKTILKGMTISELEEFVLSIGEKKFRAAQIYHGIYVDRYSDFSHFSNFSLELKNKLSELAEIPELKSTRVLSASDGTKKMTFRIDEGKEVESVWIPSGDDGRKTICISSQVGCTLSCEFCATAKLGFKGNLRTWQVLDQVIQTEKITGEKATNIVFMGMGEPMHNYDAVINAATILTDPKAFHLGAKRITISSAGVVPGIERFIQEKRPFNFAISLNHPDPKERSEIMNINKKHSLDELLKVVRKFTKTLGRKITFEYVMIPGVNMGADNAKKLVKIARSVNCKINLIPLNTQFHGWRKPTDKEIEEFKNLLKPAEVPVMNRRSPGKEIDGACGMLALKGLD